MFKSLLLTCVGTARFAFEEFPSDKKIKSKYLCRISNNFYLRYLNPALIPELGWLDSFQSSWCNQSRQSSEVYLWASCQALSRDLFTRNVLVSGCLLLRQCWLFIILLTVWLIGNLNLNWEARLFLQVLFSLSFLPSLSYFAKFFMIRLLLLRRRWIFGFKWFRVLFFFFLRRDVFVVIFILIDLVVQRASGESGDSIQSYLRLGDRAIVLVCEALLKVLTSDDVLCVFDYSLAMLNEEVIMWMIVDDLVVFFVVNNEQHLLTA